MYDLEGKVHRLAEFRGKYILLDFWSRGCGPCIMSQPELKEISEMYKDSLEVISLSIENRKGWEEASKSHAMTWNKLERFGREQRTVCSLWCQRNSPILY